MDKEDIWKRILAEEDQCYFCSHLIIYHPYSLHPDRYCSFYGAFVDKYAMEGCAKWEEKKHDGTT